MSAPDSGTIRFLLGAEPREITDAPATMTVLDYLRRRERLTGTKEGCAEGDCGACTIVLAEPDGEGGLRHWSVNSCIQFLPSLHGRQLLSVEHVRGEGGALHPVQRALVEHHGSQCGFCTPGFVMALWAAWRTQGVSDRRELKDWLSGNLCRCTGYGPILDAGEAALGEICDRSRGEAATVAALADLDDGQMLAYACDGQLWFAPHTADELAQTYLAHPDATLIAGATDVGLWVTKQHRRLATLIDVTRVPELKRLAETEDCLEIGAGVTHRAATAALARLHPDLGEVMRRFASIPIRNSGTIGGNIANGSPIGDLAPCFIALGATLRLRRGDERRSMPIEDFFLAYGKQDRRQAEFVEAVTVPRPGRDTRFAAYKLSKRFDQDISAVMAAFLVRLEAGAVTDACIAFGGMAAVPKRARQAEAALIGAVWDEAAIARAADALSLDFAPITDLRASAAYRLRAAQNLLKRFFLSNSGPEAPKVNVLEVAPA